MQHNIWLYILVMAGVSYVPYVTLAVMTFPAILEATQTPWSGLAALVVGIVLAWLGCSLFQVAVFSCAVVLAAEFFLL